MSKPDLTLDEPTATGWLRAEFYGDTDAAKGYLYDARRQLGAMRTRFGVNDRIANGEPGGFYREARTLPNGTRIESITNDGLDIVRITAQPVPVTPPPVPEIPPPVATDWVGEPTKYEDEPEFPPPPEEKRKKDPKRVQLDNYAVCGYSQDADYKAYPFHWVPDGGFTDIPRLTNYEYGYTTRLSKDGETVCGYMSGDNDVQAFYWTRQAGTVPLGVEVNSFATGVNDDGDTFCGWGEAVDGNGNYVPRAYRWELGEGTPVMTALALPNDVIEILDPAISDDGGTIVGSIRVGNGFGAYGWRAVMWTADNAPVLLPLSGIVKAESKVLQDVQHWTTYNNSGGVIAQFTRTYYPGTPSIAGAPGVAGQVVDAYSTGETETNPYAGVWPSYPYSIATRSASGGGPTSFGSEAWTGTERDVTWNVPADMFAVDVSENGVVCGTIRPPPGVAVTTPQVFRWSAQDGLQILGDGEAHAISTDGTTIVGHRNSSGNYRWFAWDAVNGMVDVGAGQANGVASAQFEDGTPTPLGTLIAGRDSANDNPGMMAVVRTEPDEAGVYEETLLGYGLGGTSSIATDITIFTEEYDID